MERVQVRFEQRRGLCAAVEGNPPYRREEMDEFMLRMLQECSIPGLLKPDAEEIDGCLSLRYPLNGARMLAQAKRASKWSMTEFMTALCRLAEVMEDCRLYALSHEYILLREDLMFVGEGWHDLRLVYLPVAEKRIQEESALSGLIVRWMLEVADPDGRAVQEVLRIACSPDFKPAGLRQFARQYLAEHSVARRLPALPEALPDPAQSRERPIQPKTFPEGGAPREPDAPDAWRWFQPPSGDRHSLSGLLGDEPDAIESEPFLEGEDEDRRTPSADRLIWFACGAAALSAAAWRFGYAEHASTGGLSFSLGATLASFAALFAFWIRSFNGFGLKRKAIPAPAPQVPEFGEKESGHLEDPPFRPPELPFAGQPTGSFSPGMERTQQLDSAGRKKEAEYYLVWESPAQPVNIRLADGDSFVIGRSREASRHVDETHGVSRAHVEFLRIADGWSVKDLGSRNGTKINDRPMVPYETYPLRTGDRLDLAGSVYRIHHGFLPGRTG